MSDTYAKGGVIQGRGEKVGYDPEVDGELITPEAARRWIDKTGALDRLNEYTKHVQSD